jgi:hypothetical protein
VVPEDDAQPLAGDRHAVPGDVGEQQRAARLGVERAVPHVVQHVELPGEQHPAQLAERRRGQVGDRDRAGVQQAAKRRPHLRPLGV